MGTKGALLGRLSRMLYAAIVIVVGIELLLGGIKLIAVGGSWYYAIAGAATFVAGLCLWFGDWRGAGVYAAMLLGTFVWALWEAGTDPWALSARLTAPIVLGLPLLVTALCSTRRRRYAGVAALSVMAALVGVVWWSQRSMSEAAPISGPIVESAVGEHTADWLHYGNTQSGNRHSPLTQITPDNVAKLQVAWSTYLFQPLNGLKTVKFEATPLKIGDSLYTCTGLNDIFALDASTGAIRWHFDAELNYKGIPNGTCRGLAYYRVPSATGVCSARLYTATVDAHILAVDAATGVPCHDFGDNGRVDLQKGMGPSVPGYYYVTSAPTVVRGRLVVGGFVADGQETGEPSGVIRAFDAVTGKLSWAWDMGNSGVHTEPAEGQTYTRGTPNSWAPMAADETLGLVFVPTGNAGPDYFGAHRSKEMETYSTSLVAIDAETGEPRWHFQAVHHDVWDYDVSAQPNLIDIPSPKGVVPAVVQPTKNGEVFVLDRRTGAPVFPVTERPAPQGPVEGDWLSPTQPHSAIPDLIGARLTERAMWGATPIDQLWCRIKFREARYEGPFTPLTLRPTIVQPGFSGGIEWGSSTFDPATNYLVLNANFVVNRNRLMSREETDRRGLFPSKDPPQIEWGHVPQAGTPYGAETVPFLSPTGAPCTQPPYSALTAIDLTTGRRVWSRPLGLARSIGVYGFASHLPLTIGTPTFGGAITTASGLIFIAATLDHAIRAFDIRTGRMLWQADLPADGLATPMTYEAPNGRQYLVVGVGDAAAGLKAEGSALGGRSAGGTLVAFALPPVGN